MFDYLAFHYAGISTASSNARRDGENLAAQCLRKLNRISDKNRFPPRLLILLASPAYIKREKAEQLLQGVNTTFGCSHPNVELIGSSVGGVFFDRKVYPKGALLVCLASTLVEARVAWGENARRDPKGAIKDLLKQLELHRSRQIDPNPLANRLIITFMPGCNQESSNRVNGALYPAPELHRLLYEGVQERIWMTGGVSSANDRTRHRDGFQFAHDRVLHDSVVAASVITGVPIGVSLNDGLVPTKKILSITRLGGDKRTVLAFDGKKPVEQFDGADNLMLAKLSAHEERIVDIPLPLPDGSVRLLRPHKRGDHFEIFRPGRDVVKIAMKGIAQAKRRVYVQRPIACLLFPCKAYNPRHKSGIKRAEKSLTKIEQALKSKENPGGRPPCIGGFFDGEIGVDEKGRSRLTNGGVGYVIFGDEIRERTPLYQGVSALAKYGYRLLPPELTPSSIYETIENALDIVSRTGFPGAMLSLIQSSFDRRINNRKRQIIARHTVGPRFAKIRDHTKRPCDGQDVLALVAKDSQSRFIPDSRRDPSCNQEAIKLSGVVSQYVLPLRRLDKSVGGTLQVDLGDLRHLSPEAFKQTEKARMLDCLGEVISASINRIATAVENEIKLDLDRALSGSLSSKTVHEGIERFFKAAGKAFGVEMGHLRLVEGKGSRKQSLTLETGFGACYEAEKHKRHQINVHEFTPICCAFSSIEPHVVNDVDEDPAFQAMLKNVSSDRELYRRLNQTKSYSAVSFADESGRRIGAFSFGSTQRWFFLKLHRQVLTALANRLGVLIQHLKAKIARDFMLHVSPKLAERNLNEDEKIFNDVAGDFRTALNAEFASLYLWDEDTQRYVLRGQSGWKDERWVHAANYDANSGWLGVTAIKEKPLYVPNLSKYYQEHEYGWPRGRYAAYMFGQPLSQDFTVEAIGLPLQIGPDAGSITGNGASARKSGPGTPKFGVLTLYRGIRPGQRTGFITTDIPLLQQGAYAAAGLINAVLWHRANEWEEEEENRRHRLYQGLTGTEGDVFEARVCQEVLKIFGATEVEFYRADRFRYAGGSFRGTVLYSWIAGYRLVAGSGKMEKLKRSSADHNDLLKESIVPGKRRQSYRISNRRREITAEQRGNPEAVKTEGLVEQVCIPLVGDKKHLGSLVVRWRIGPHLAFSLKSRHDEFNLQILGRILGSAYVKHKAKSRVERSNKAVQTAGLYVAQHAHRLGSAISVLRRLSLEARNAQDETLRRRSLKELESTAQGYMGELNWRFDFGEIMQNPARENFPLDYLLKRCWLEIAGSRRKVDKIDFRNVDDITIIADPRLMKEVFFNLINNAIEAMDRQKEKNRRKTRLIITASVSEDKESLRIVFSDNGVGMNRRQLSNAYRGFKPSGGKFRKLRHKGVGVLISRYMLSVQDGNLAHFSKPGKGTDAIVTLRNFRIKRRNDEVATTD